MKQLLILSGKGGTGKTTIAAGLIHLSKARALADCDVDAPNLHLVSSYKDAPETKAFYGMDKAKINPQLCSQCGLCLENCRFDAISPDYKVNPFACEGCALCKALCPTKAITMEEALAGNLHIYNHTGSSPERANLFSSARLTMGSGNSGKLVTEVKKQLIPMENLTDLAIIDGSPGLGCPVIASLSGVDYLLLVAEPSVSGISDLIRIIDTAEMFKVKMAICINKYDVNLEKTREIEEFCHNKSIALAGKIPYDIEAIRATNRGENLATLVSPGGVALRTLHETLQKTLLVN